MRRHLLDIVEPWFDGRGLKGGVFVALGFIAAYTIAGSALISVAKAALGIIFGVIALGWLLSIGVGHVVKNSTANRWASLGLSTTVLLLVYVPFLHSSRLGWFTSLWSATGAFAGFSIVVGFVLASIRLSGGNGSSRRPATPRARTTSGRRTTTGTARHVRVRR